MATHTHILEIVDHPEVDDEVREVRVYRRCTVKGCEYWRHDYFAYEYSETPDGMEELADLE